MEVNSDSVRRQRERNLRLGLGEKRAALRERIDVRRADLGVAVGAQVVGAQGVNGNQDDRNRLRRVLGEAGGKQAAHQREKTQSDRDMKNGRRHLRAKPPAQAKRKTVRHDEWQAASHKVGNQYIRWREEGGASRRGSAGRRSRNQTRLVGQSSMWAPFVRAKPALDCGSSSYRLPPLLPTAIAQKLERERR